MLKKNAEWGPGGSAVISGRRCAGEHPGTLLKQEKRKRMRPLKKIALYHLNPFGQDSERIIALFFLAKHHQQCYRSLLRCRSGGIGRRANSGSSEGSLVLVRFRLGTTKSKGYGLLRNPFDCLFADF